MLDQLQKQLSFKVSKYSKLVSVLVASLLVGITVHGAISYTVISIIFLIVFSFNEMISYSEMNSSMRFAILANFIRVSSEQLEKLSDNAEGKYVEFKSSDEIYKKILSETSGRDLIDKFVYSETKDVLPILHIGYHMLIILVPFGIGKFLQIMSS